MMRKITVAMMAAVAVAACSEPTSVPSPNLVVQGGRQTSPPPSSITVTALGSLPYSKTISGAPIASAINNGSSRSATRVAGYTMYGTTREYGFTWTSATGMTPLDIPELGYTWPNGISDNGLIVGEFARMGGPNYAFTATASTPMSYLPVPAGTTYSRATGITADGSCISGWVRGSAGQAVLWRNNAIEVVGTGSASGVSNDCLSVAGHSDGRAVVWRLSAGTWSRETLPAVGDGIEGGASFPTEATDISPNGTYVAGRRMDTDSVWHATVWRRTAGGWTATDMPGTSWYAFGVDNAGRAVGNGGNDEPIVWVPASNGTYSAKVLPGLERTTRGWAAAINELGQIVGRSYNRYGAQPVMWTLPQ